MATLFSVVGCITDAARQLSFSLRLKQYRKLLGCPDSLHRISSYRRQERGLEGSTTKVGPYPVVHINMLTVACSAPRVTEMPKCSKPLQKHIWNLFVLPWADWLWWSM
jgi:hypothetical protein